MGVPADGMTGEALAAVTELLELRGQPITLVPTSGTVVEKPGGGKDYTPAAPRDPQVFAKFSPDSRAETLGESRAPTDQGPIRSFRFRMIGSHDAVVALGDSWEDDTARYSVAMVDLTLPYQVTAWVTGFLKVPGHSG